MIFSKEDRRYYIYRHLKASNGLPFYIGLAQKAKDFRTPAQEYKRAFQLGSSGKRNKFWKNTYKKHGCVVEIVIENLTAQEAKAKEVELIALYGRRKNGGILCNMTDGGDGATDAEVDPSCRWGKRKVKCALTQHTASEFKTLYNNTNITVKELAKRFKISKQLANYVVKGHIWGWVSPTIVPRDYEEGKKTNSKIILEIKDKITAGVSVNDLCAEYKFHYSFFYRLRNNVFKQWQDTGGQLKFKKILGRPKLNEDQVREIRRLRKDGVKMKVLEEKFAVNRQTIRHIVNRTLWKQVA